MQSNDKECTRPYAEGELRRTWIVTCLGGPGMLLDVEIMESLQLHPLPAVNYFDRPATTTWKTCLAKSTPTRVSFMATPPHSVTGYFTAPVWHSMP